LGLKDATALVIGCVVGVGIFRMAAPVAEHLPSVALIMAVWVLGGVLAFCGALCFAELGAAYPKSGGDYIYITRAYGPAAGFLFGWTKLFVERIATLAILGVVFAEYLGFLVPYGAFGTRWVAVAAIAALSAVNVVGIQVGKEVQNLLTLLKLLALGGIVILGLWGTQTIFPPAQPVLPQTIEPGTLRALGLALVFVIWTYGGWNEVNYVAEEVKNPQKTLPWAILGGVALITLLYLAVNAIYLYYVPLNQMPQTPLVAAEVMRRIVGPVGGVLTSLAVALSAFGALNGEILTGGRIAMAIGRDHPIFSKLAQVHSKFSTPALALGFNAAGAMVLVWVGTFEQLVTYSTVILSIFFAMTALAVPLLRKQDPDTPRPYRVWGYPFTLILFIGAMVLFVVNVVWMQPKEALWGLGLLLVGVPLYGGSQLLAARSKAR